MKIILHWILIQNAKLSHACPLVKMLLKLWYKDLSTKLRLVLLSFCPEAITFLSVMFLLVYCSLCGKKKHLILNFFNP